MLFHAKLGIEKFLVRSNLIPADLLVDGFERHLISVTGDLERELYKNMFQKPFRVRNIKWKVSLKKKKTR